MDNTDDYFGLGNDEEEFGSDADHWCQDYAKSVVKANVSSMPLFCECGYCNKRWHYWKPQHPLHQKAKPYVKGEK